jgi:hypothetical protein
MKKNTVLARQVGASIINENEDIVSVGVNELPRVGGGVSKDAGNFALGYDPNDMYKNFLIHNFLSKLIDLKIIVKPNSYRKHYDS